MRYYPTHSRRSSSGNKNFKVLIKWPSYLLLYANSQRLKLCSYRYRLTFLIHWHYTSVDPFMCNVPFICNLTAIQQTSEKQDKSDFSNDWFLLEPNILMPDYFWLPSCFIHSKSGQNSLVFCMAVQILDHFVCLWF
jgi:hypothetical protein